METPHGTRRARADHTSAPFTGVLHPATRRAPLAPQKWSASTVLWGLGLLVVGALVFMRWAYVESTWETGEGTVLSCQSKVVERFSSATSRRKTREVVHSMAMRVRTTAGKMLRVERSELPGECPAEEVLAVHFPPGEPEHAWPVGGGDGAAVATVLMLVGLVLTVVGLPRKEARRA